MAQLRREKKHAQTAAKTAGQKARALVAETEGPEAAAEVRLPPWRELLGSGPREGQVSAGEAEASGAPALEPEAEPAPEAPSTPLMRRAWLGAPLASLPDLPSTPGSPLDASLRERLERAFGHDFGHVRIHVGSEAAAAAQAVRASAFTVGSHVYFDHGAFAPGTPAGDLLLVHELTHVVQHDQGRLPDATGWQVSSPDHPAELEAYSNERQLADRLAPRPVPGPPAPTTIASPDELDEGWILRDGLFDVDVVGWIRDNVAGAAEAAIPGYSVVTQVFGRDPIRDRTVPTSSEELIEALLTWGPFGQAVAPLLTAMDVLGEVLAYVQGQLTANGLTVARLQRDLAAAWEEFSITLGVSGNVAIARRYLSALLRDLTRFVSSIVDRVLAIVRDVVVDFVEPILARPEIAPVWDLAKKVFHYDPLRGERVDAPTVEILADFLALIGEDDVLAQMQERGTLQQTADWLDTQWATFTALLDEARGLFADAWDAISPENLPGLLDSLPDLVQRGVALVGGVLEFGGELLAKVLELVKDALLEWLASYANEIPGFHLLTVILERNPFTGEAVPRTAENLIRGFISLLPGGEAMYQELAESGVIGESAARIESAMASLGITWELVTTTFLGVWDLVTLESLLAPLDTFRQIVDAFGEPLSRILAFVRVVMETVVTLILALMNFPSELLGNIIANTVASIETIMADPVAFLNNLVEALKAGFLSFLDHIATHLLQGLAQWLFRGLSELGIEPPADLQLSTIFEFVLQVLDLTEETMWRKLGEVIGEERVAQIREALDRLSGALAFIRDVQERGLAAVWDLVASQLSNLWSSILEMATAYITETIVGRVVARLISMLDPTGVMAVVNSFLVFFDTVRSVIEYIREILEIVDRWVTTVADVAAGRIETGAAMLEAGLAQAIPVALGFLANIIGLGNVPDKIREIILRLREQIDRALTWVIEQAVRLGRAALNALGLGPADQSAEDQLEGFDGEVGETVQFSAGGEGHRLWIDGSRTMVASQTMTVAERIADWRRRLGDEPSAEDGVGGPSDVPGATGLLSRADDQLSTVVSEAAQVTTAPAEERGEQDQEVEDAQAALAGSLRQLFELYADEIPEGVSPEDQIRHEALVTRALSELRTFVRDLEELDEGGLRRARDRAEDIERRLQPELREGIDLSMTLSPTEGTPPDSVMATARIAPNTTEQTEELSANVQAFMDRFAVASPQAGTPVEMLNGRAPSRPLAMATMVGQDRVPGYVVNIVARPTEVYDTIAMRYLMGTAWRGSKLADVAKARTAVVIGINYFRSIDETHEAATRQAINAAVARVAVGQYAVVGVFGFLWEPRWTEGGAAVPLQQVRVAWGEISPAERADPARARAEDQVPQNLPFGSFRNAVLEHTFTGSSVDALSAQCDPVYVLVQDADGGTIGEGGDGVLTEYDTFLDELGRHPLLVIGGYRFTDFDWGPDADERTRQLTELTNRIERAVRTAIGEVFPEMLYPTEPNLLVKARDREDRDGVRDRGIEQGLFGTGYSEGRTARDTIMDANEASETPTPDPIAHAPRAAVTTSPRPDAPDRGLVVSGPRAAEAAAQGQAPFVAIEEQRQNMLTPDMLRTEFERGSGVRSNTRVRRELLARPIEAARTLADDPQAEIADTSGVDRESLRPQRQMTEPERQRIDDALRRLQDAIQRVIATLTTAEMRAVFAELKAVLDEISAEGDDR